jgi:hypothetical protein
MNHLPKRWSLLAVPALLTAPLLLAGCGTSADAQSTAGMSMAPGAPMTPDGATEAATTPPDTALMVCGKDISTQVVQVLKLDGPPKTDSDWTHSVYTCTYHLPMGDMVLSVQVAKDHGSAADLLAADRARRAPTQDQFGLGERAFGTPAGVTVVLKDNEILTVDATRLPAVFGDNDQHRTDLANEIASDVLGCWTGDGDE